MTSLYGYTCGEGETDLVLLHGWGLNAEVWQSIVPRLSAQFRLHLIDLPGYGRSQGFTAMTLDEMAEQLLPSLHCAWLVAGGISGNAAGINGT